MAAGEGYHEGRLQLPVWGAEAFCVDEDAMAKWMIYAKKADFQKIAGQMSLSPVTVRVMRNRDLTDAEQMREFLHGTIADLTKPQDIPGLKDAAFVLRHKILEGKSIRIIGDYDVDGICSTYILWRLMDYLGGKVSARIPERLRDGYGINDRLVEEAIADGTDTLITCDNGIAAVSPLQKAKDAGLTVIVTDHHEIPFILKNGEKEYIYPPADVIAEPWIPDSSTGKPKADFPQICGAVVVFQLARILLGDPDFTGEKSALEPEPTAVIRELLGFAALATVCDVMPLTGPNRLIVRAGLKELTRTDNTGIRCLLEVSGLRAQELSVYCAGFVLGPCLNAAGRLDTAARALELFMEKDESRAMILAGDLKQLNDSRRSMTEQGLEQAIREINRRMESGADPNRHRVLVLYLENCHESLAGIIAGRVRERYHRPTIVLTDSDEPGILKGSGRSMEAYDMFEELSRCRELFVKFGGHKMAAGLSIRKENAALLEERLNAACRLEESDLQEILHIDMELPLFYVSIPLVRELSMLEPCGTANSRPIFAARNVKLCKTAVYGKSRNVIRMEGFDEQGGEYELVWFRPEEELPPEFEQGIVWANIVYEPKINIWKGRENIQFVIKDLKIVDA